MPKVLKCFIVVEFQLGSSAKLLKHSFRGRPFTRVSESPFLQPTVDMNPNQVISLMVCLCHPPKHHSGETYGETHASLSVLLQDCTLFLQKEMHTLYLHLLVCKKELLFCSEEGSPPLKYHFLVLLQNVQVHSSSESGLYKTGM